MLWRLVLVFCLVSNFIVFITHAQPEKLRPLVTQIASRISADVGVTIVDLTTGDSLSVNGGKRFPMQSVFKFHIGLAALHQVEAGKLFLDQKYHVTKGHYFPTWSVLMRNHPEADIDVTLRDLISWSVMNSDNVACDMLLDILGGPLQVDRYIKSFGISDISIVANEKQMHNEWEVQFDNWTTPGAMADLLKLFYEGKILKPEHNAFLWKLMVDTPNAPKRLKGMLPEGSVVARKPGTGAPNADGVLGAVNDVGILVLPDGRKVIVAAFVTNTKESASAAEKVIAEISKAVFDHYRID